MTNDVELMIPAELSRLTKSKKSALPSIEHQAELDVYVSGTHVGPHLPVTKEDYVRPPDEAAKHAGNKNML